MKMTGAQAVIQALLREGVELLFGYPGGAIMPIYDALHEVQDQLRHILVRHEQGAVHAAEGYAKVTGRPGVCFATSGPGATNLLTGLADAMLDSVPLVCVTGQVASNLLGTDAFQEADIIGMSLPVTKWNFQVTNAAELSGVMAKAFHIASSGRPGPVLVDVTKDAQMALVDFEYQPWKASVSTVDESALEQTAALLNEAKRPFLFVGQGVLLSGAEPEVLTLAEKLSIPIASTLLGLSAVPTGHPLFMGMLGMHGSYGPNLLTNSADVIVAIGMRFDDRVTGNLEHYAKQAKIVHIEIDPVEIGKNVAAEVGVLGDAKTVLQSLLPKVQTHARRDKWLAEFQHCADKEYQAVIKTELARDQAAVKMAEVVELLCQKTEGTAIVVTDVGQHQMVTARYAKFTQTRSFLSSGGLGTMGYALPAAIGAKLGAPERQVVAVAGDGGFQMNLQELGVLMQEKLPVKILVLNNGYLGMVRQWQELFFDKHYSFVEIQSPDFVAVAAAYEIAGQCVENRADLDQALETMLNFEGPYLLEVRVENQEKVFPMITPGKSVDEVSLGE